MTSKTRRRARRPDCDVAIIGMSCIFPGAGDLDTFWSNIESGHDAIREVPPQRWEPDFYDPDSKEVNRVYCRRGGFIDELAAFDALHWGIMPLTVEACEPDQLLALEVAARALGDAGYSEANVPHENTGVVLGRGGYVTRGMARFATKVRNSEELVQNLRVIVPDLTEDQMDALRREFCSRLEHHGPDNVIGLVPNLAASRVANRLDLHGPAYTIDAACASSLVAVERACSDLMIGKSDLMLAGGIHLVQDISFWSVFCQLGALSRSETIRPFDLRADGTLCGEGIGILVLKRRPDAERDGDRIYATIRGTGVASDGRGTSVMNPAIEGQERALERAWRMAGLEPRAAGSLGLIEAHGAGTLAGDLAELTTLNRFFGPPREKNEVALGTIKSMIGHAMPAAGAAGLIKAALAVYHRTLPPTLNCEQPHPSIQDSRFRLVRESEPWEGNGSPRRAGVNAFGFGGINAHVLLEECPESRTKAVSVSGPERTPKVLMLASDSPAELERALEEWEHGSRRSPGRGKCRLALTNPTPERIQAAKTVTRRATTLHGRRGLWFSPRGLVGEGGKIAFVFPGVDAEFQPRVDDVASFFGRKLLPEAELTSGGNDLEQKSLGIVLVNGLLSEVLTELRVTPDYLCGHSIGEWNAMIASGVVLDSDVRELIRSLEPGRVQFPDVIFLAAGCGRARAEEVMRGLPELVVSHDNCGHQVVLCGREQSVDELVSRFRSHRVLCQKLDFRSGFHTPMFREFLGPLATVVQGLPLRRPDIPVWSATTCKPYPFDPEQIRNLMLDHLVSPVEFRRLTEQLYADGARVFLQVGTGSLVGFVKDVLNDRPHLAMSANVPKHDGLHQLRQVLAALWVEGADVDCERLFDLYQAPAVSHSRRGTLLKLGAPLVRLDGSSPIGSLALGARRAPAAGIEDPVLQEVHRTLAAVERATNEVVDAWQSRRTVAAPPRTLTEQRRLDIDRDHHLLDHCFFPQPRDWPHPGDRGPIVPMTMSLAMMSAVARKLAGGKIITGFENVRARRWIGVEEPRVVTIEARLEADDDVFAKVKDFIECRVKVAKQYPSPPKADASPCKGEYPSPIPPEHLYEPGRLFHGPSYQGVREVTAVGEKEIKGVIEPLPAEGALLDCAGQVFAIWILINAERDWMVAPVKLDAVTFYGPEPPPGSRLDCRVFVKCFEERRAVADIEVSSEGRVWCRLKGWENRRFELSDRMSSVIRDPERNLLASPHEGVPDCCVLREDLRNAATRHYFARRYLDGREHRKYLALTGQQQMERLPRQIAAKDAARLWLRNHGCPPHYPIEIELHRNEPRGLRATCRNGPELRIALASSGSATAALATDADDVRLRVLRTTPGDASLEDLGLSPNERALLPGEQRDEWMARFRAAKETLAATGDGRSTFEVEARDQRRVKVSGTWVGTWCAGDEMFAWTPADAESLVQK